MPPFWTTTATGTSYTYPLQTDTVVRASSGIYYYNTSPTVLHPHYVRIDSLPGVADDELAELIKKSVQKNAEVLKQKQAQDHEAWLQCFEEE